MLTLDSGLFDLCRGDLKSAILLNQILFWSDVTNDPDGWFYKTYEEWELETTLSRYEINRILHGDKRSSNHRSKITLADLGVETMVRRGRFTGNPTVHYRVNVDKYKMALAAFIQERDGIDAEAAMKYVLDIFESEHEFDEDEGEFEEEPLIVLPHSKLRQILTPELQQSRMTQSQQSRVSKESEITTDQESSENDSNISHPPPDDDSDLQIFSPYLKRFGKLKKQIPALLSAELQRLGADRVGQVLERCATRGRSWIYVLRALENESPPPSAPVIAFERPIAAPDAEGTESIFVPQIVAAPQIPVSPRIHTPTASQSATFRTPFENWSAASHQMQMQFGAASFLIDEAVLVDFDAETAAFTVVVRNQNVRDQLQQRYYRTVRRIMSDVFGNFAEVYFVAKADWVLPENLNQHGG